MYAKVHYTAADGSFKELTLQRPACRAPMLKAAADGSIERAHPNCLASRSPVLKVSKRSETLVSGKPRIAYGILMATLETVPVSPNHEMTQ